MPQKMTYDTSMGTQERSVISATKTWGFIIAILFLVGLFVLFVLYYGMGTGSSTSGGVSSENTATRPAEP